MRRQSTSGVSQLELMISLIIMGLIAVLLTNALNFNRQSLERSRFLSDDTDMILAQHRLRNWIEDIPLDYAGGTAPEFFDGKPDHLRFKSLVTDQSFRQDVPAEFTISLEVSDGVYLLQVTGNGQHSGREATYTLIDTLAADVSNLTIHYFGRLSTEPEKRWHETWSDAVYLPDLVKIEWETNRGHPAPPLTLQPGKAELYRNMSLSSLVPPG